MEMHPYWLTVENPPRFSAVSLGVGITAYSEDEARNLFTVAFGNSLQIAKVHTIRTLDEIDQGHVRPNMGNHLVQGIWYPLGFEASK